MNFNLFVMVFGANEPRCWNRLQQICESTQDKRFGELTAILRHYLICFPLKYCILFYKITKKVYEIINISKNI